MYGVEGIGGGGGWLETMSDAGGRPFIEWKSVIHLCRSVNEVICHGIPDARELQDGDICNGKADIMHIFIFREKCSHASDMRLTKCGFPSFPATKS